MPRRKVVLLLVVAVALAVGLGVAVVFFELAPAPLPATITAASWQLQAITFDRRRQLPLADHPITLRFHPQDQTASGSAGCNAYSLTYTSDHTDSFRVYADRTTFNTCTPATVMTLESSYLDVLRHMESYHLAGQTLTLMDGNGAVTLTFVLSASS